jgi:hypothetical protein
MDKPLSEECIASETNSRAKNLLTPSNKSLESGESIKPPMPVTEDLNLLVLSGRIKQ